MLPTLSNEYYASEFTWRTGEVVVRIPKSAGMYLKYTTNYLIILLLATFVLIRAYAGASSAKYSTGGLLLVGYILLSYALISMMVVSYQYVRSGMFVYGIRSRTDSSTGEMQLLLPDGGALKIVATKIDIKVANWVRVHNDEEAVCVMASDRIVVILAVGIDEVRKVINELSTNNIKIESVETCRLVLSDFMTPSSR